MTPLVDLSMPVYAAGGPESIPSEHCFGDGVVLDFTWAEVIGAIAEDE